MRILTVHADYIEVEPKKKAIKDAENVEKEKKRYEEVLVVFTAVEKNDEKDLEAITKKYVEEVKDVAKQVKVDNILLYPYAHLSSSLSDPKKAEKVMKDAEKLLEKEFKASRAPFGWYKAFNIAAKGHPLSELSREFTVEGEGKKEVSKALKAEKKLVSRFYIVNTDGKVSEIKYSKQKNEFSGFDFTKHPKLRKFAAYEMAKERTADQEPPHVRYMKKLELVDYEPGSDPGNLRYYPKGKLIKKLIEKHTTKMIKDNGGMEIETPIMYDFEHPSLKSYLNRFPARQYTIETPNRKVFLRFSACFGQFLMAHDANISYKQLPLWIYELTHYSFRVEQRGELTGLRRLRTFTMPDCHAFCADEKQAKSELIRRLELSYNLQKEMGLDPKQELELGLRLTKKFWENNEEFVQSLVKKWKKPALLEMWDEQFFYFNFKYEFNFVDSLDKCSALTTDQIDVENGKRYGITYVDQKGDKKHPLILHLSPSGAVERVMYSLLEKAYLDHKQGKLPSIPLWLSPTQVRLVPVSNDKHLKYCEKLAEQINKEKIRVDIDDKEEGVGKKIRNAGQEWIPYTIVIGDDEVKGKKKFIVRDREKNEDVKMELEKLIKLIKEKTAGMSYDTLPVPRNLSKRIIFVG